LEIFLGFLETLAFIFCFGVATIHPNQFEEGIASDFFTGFTVVGLFSWWINSFPTKIDFYHKRASLDSKLVIGYWNIHFFVWGPSYLLLGLIFSKMGAFICSWALISCKGTILHSWHTYISVGLLFSLMGALGRIITSRL
jgi:hypothetical protein